MSRSAWRRRRWLIVTGIVVALFLGSGFAFLRIKLEGPDLGDKVASILNYRMRGRIEIGSIEWPTSALKKVVTGGWVPITVRDVKVWDDCALSADLSDEDTRRFGDPDEDCTPDDRPDPDPKSKRQPRKLLLETQLITAEIDVHAILFGAHDIVLRNIWVHGGEALLEQTREPYPLHAYDRTIVSIVSAFYPRMKPGFRAGIYADGAPPVFDLRDIHVKDMNLTVQLAPSVDGTEFGLAARIEGANVDAVPEPHDPQAASYLYMDGRDPLVQKFYVRLAMTANKGKLRIIDEGPRATFRIPGKGLNQAWGQGREAFYEIDLDKIVLNRLAQLPTEWPRNDNVANTLEVDAYLHTVPCAVEGMPKPDPKDGADLRLVGSLLDWWDRPYDGKWDFKLDIKNFGPTLRSCIKSTMGGDDLGGEIRIEGPYIADPKVVLDLHGLDFDIPLSAKEDPIRLTLAEVHGALDLVNDVGYIDKTKALVRGGKEPGEVMVSATFGLKPPTTTADIDITHAIDVGRFLPPSVASAAGRFLQGKLSVNGDTIEGFELKNFDLRLGPTTREHRLRVHSGRMYTEKKFDKLVFENIRFEAGKSYARIDGRLEYEPVPCPQGSPTDEVCEKYVAHNLGIDGEFPDFGVWLERFGLPPIIQSISGGITADTPAAPPTPTAPVKPQGVVYAQAGSPSTSNRGGKIIINGPITAPTISATATLQGIPCIGNVRIERSSFAGGIANVEFSTIGLGGTVRGTATLDTNQTPVYLQDLKLNGQKLNAAKLCGLGGIVSGTVDKLDVQMNKVSLDKKRPPLDWLAYVKAKASASKISVVGDDYSDIAVCVNQSVNDPTCRPNPTRARLDADDLVQCELGKSGTKNGGFCAVASATRDAGGSLDATIVNIPGVVTRGVRQPAKLDGTITLDNTPLALLDPLIGKLGEATLGGVVSAAFHLGGTMPAASHKDAGPTADGNIDLLRAWALDNFIGDMKFQIDPTIVAGMPGVLLRGSGMSGNLAVAVELGTQAPYPVRLELTTRRLELDAVIDLQKMIGFPEPIQAWMTGVVTVTTELSPKNGKPAIPDGWVEIQELEAIVDHRAEDGRLTPLRFALAKPKERGKNAMSLHVTPSTIELACRDASAPTGRTPCPAQLETPAGTVTIEGGASQTSMALHATGELQLRRLAGLVETTLESLGGKLILDAKITGTLSKPSYEVGLTLDQVSLRPAGVETELQANEGLIKLSNGTLGFTSVKLQVKDERRDDQGELTIKGTIGLDGFRPATWGLLVEGKIAGKMLRAFAPSAISQAGGLARIDGALVLFGQGRLPLVQGTLSFDGEDGQRGKAPLTISPRGIRRELAFLAGSIDINTTANGAHRTYEIEVQDNPITVSIDGEGTIEHIHGNFVLADFQPDHGTIELDADNIPFRTADRSLDLVLSARDVSLVLPSPTSVWRVRGDVAMISGTYRRNFELTEVLKPAPQTAAPVKPFWDEYPSIGGADLGLTLDIRKFSVASNIAQIDLDGTDIEISGTPRDPRLSGQLRVQRGEFKLPGTRARFTDTTGTIDFTQIDRASNPKLDITSIAPDYLDLSGQLHTITLAINGTLDTLNLDLHTSTGLNHAQTIALLFLGRSPEQLRRSLGDTTPGAAPVISNNPSTYTGGVADELAKDLAGSYVSSLIGDTLTKLTGLDVLRLSFGFGSVGVHAEKRALENINTIGDAEQTIRGSTKNVRIEVRTKFDGLAVEGAYLDKNFNDPAEPDIQDVQIKFVYRLFIP